MTALFSRVIPLALAALTLDAGVAVGQTPAGPPPGVAAPAGPAYEITGFRSAKFGMTPAQVRAAIVADFGANVKITEAANPAEGTTALQATVDQVAPGPGAANLAYIFGATSKTLTHVNVVWSLAGEPSAEQRAGIVTAAIQLTNYFQTLDPPPKATANATPLGPNSLLMFAAVDTKGAAIQVGVDGVSYQAKTGNKATESPTPTGPAVLRVSYALNAINPDVVRLKRGSF